MRDTSPLSRRRVAALLAVAVVTALPGCGQQKAALQIGLKRVALDLAFKADVDADGKPKPKQLTALPPLPTPVQPSYVLTASNTLAATYPTTTLAPIRPSCPAAPPGAVPDQPVAVTVTKAPLAGIYNVRNKGTLKVSGGLVNLSTAYPEKTTKEIKDVKDVTAPPDPTGQPGARTITFDVNEALGDGYTLTSYQITSSALSLVKRVTKVGTSTATFTPTPAIQLVGFGTGEGASWNQAGTDLTNGTTGVVQGKILKRETVDVCGTVVDTYRVQSSERYVSLSPTGSYNSATKDTANGSDGNPGLPNYYNVATQFGGVFVQIETHTTTTVDAYTLDIDNVGTMMSVTPAGQ